MRNYIIEKGDIDRLLKGKVLATIDGGFRVEVINMDKMTNGDVIKELFPNAEIRHGIYGIENLPLVCLCLNTNIKMCEAFYAEDWWNAPFMEGE